LNDLCSDGRWRIATPRTDPEGLMWAIATHNVSANCINPQGLKVVVTGAVSTQQPDTRHQRPLMRLIRRAAIVWKSRGRCRLHLMVRTVLSLNASV
jgi:hypothetical protein